MRHLKDVLTGYCPIPPKTRLASFTVMVEESIHLNNKSRIHIGMGILKIQKLTKLNQLKLVLHRVLVMWKLSAMCFGKLVDLDKSVINQHPWLPMALYSCGFDFINVLDGRELDSHHGL